VRKLNEIGIQKNRSALWYGIKGDKYFSHLTPFYFFQKEFHDGQTLLSKITEKFRVTPELISFLDKSNIAYIQRRERHKRKGGKRKCNTV